MINTFEKILIRINWISKYFWIDCCKDIFVSCPVTTMIRRSNFSSKWMCWCWIFPSLISAPNAINVQLHLWKYRYSSQKYWQVDAKFNNFVVSRIRAKLKMRFRLQFNCVIVISLMENAKPNLPFVSFLFSKQMFLKNTQSVLLFSVIWVPWIGYGGRLVEQRS